MPWQVTLPCHGAIYNSTITSTYRDALTEAVSSSKRKALRPVHLVNVQSTVPRRPEEKMASQLQISFQIVVICKHIGMLYWPYFSVLDMPRSRWADYSIARSMDVTERPS